MTQVFSPWFRSGARTPCPIRWSDHFWPHRENKNWSDLFDGWLSGRASRLCGMNGPASAVGRVGWFHRRELTCSFFWRHLVTPRPRELGDVRISRSSQPSNTPPQGPSSLWKVRIPWPAFLRTGAFLGVLPLPATAIPGVSVVVRDGHVRPVLLL